LTLLDVLLTEELREDFIAEGKNLLLFDALYDAVLQNLDLVAEEANEKRALSYDSMAALMDRALKGAAAQLRMADSAGLADVHFAWLEKMEQHGRRGAFLRTVEEWKKASFPHLSDTLLVVVTFLFDRLIPVYGASVKDGRRYDGRIAPQNIGRRKDFWYRLTLAYRDLLIQEVLSQDKRKKNTTPEAFVDRYFHSFTPLHNDRLSSDPVRFPGFRVSIEQALEGEQIPCGIVTGLGEFKGEGGPLRCGVVISNVAFQAGSFDMASAEKFCELLVTCAEQRLPVLCFISSGGMQTKEGAGALFSMAAVNDRITRFVRDIDLPVVVFGFGDCTGGAQASFVTHPLVQTYYFSGTNMPFAGQIVVPSNLPSHCTLSNYLSRTSGAMQGLVRHPFSEGLDGALAAIDPDIPVPTDSVEGVVARVMAGIYVDDSATVAEEVVAAAGSGEPTPVKRTLIHARGCTAAKLVRVARAEGIEVVLVQSDPDMESPAADMLGPKDRLVCIGGNTPDESYLNGLSVVRVAELEKVDSLHPGIGFLSENAQFAELCRNHGINFIGPPVTSMETMGNKSNAISTARSLGVPVVPGS
ncbi:MAG: biotin carboxylase N-terminal domain-containing protein, partial [Pseudomonadales bacterium]